MEALEVFNPGDVSMRLSHRGDSDTCRCAVTRLSSKTPELCALSSQTYIYLPYLFKYGGNAVRLFRPGWCHGFYILGTDGPKRSVSEPAGHLPAGLHSSHRPAVSLVPSRLSVHVPGLTADLHRSRRAVSGVRYLPWRWNLLRGRTAGGDQAQGAKTGLASALQGAAACRQHPGEEEDAEHQFCLRGAALPRTHVSLREAAVKDRHSETGHSVHRPAERDPHVRLRPQVLCGRVHEERL